MNEVYWLSVWATHCGPVVRGWNFRPAGDSHLVWSHLVGPRSQFWCENKKWTLSAEKAVAVDVKAHCWKPIWGPLLISYLLKCLNLPHPGVKVVLLRCIQKNSLSSSGHKFFCFAISCGKETVCSIREAAHLKQIFFSTHTHSIPHM